MSYHDTRFPLWTSQWTIKQTRHIGRLTLRQTKCLKKTRQGTNRQTAKNKERQIKCLKKTRRGTNRQTDKTLRKTNQMS